MAQAADSREYFEKNAGQWDGMRKGFFSDNVREQAFKVAGVRSGATAADLGAGTGFMTEGLVGRGLRVIAVDEVKEMLDQIRSKVGDASTVDCRVGESERLPVRDCEVDYAFANMYLHHVERPAEAIAEIYRILKAGGRLVLTDLDSHNYDYLRVEHHDRWMGFDRADIGKWLTTAGFRDVSVDCVGESCSSQSSTGCSASISIFIAAGNK
jgi:ubiquinone/menaquinone biosynthesis C-methylase UbiE